MQRAKDGVEGKGAPGDDFKIVHLDQELTLEERQLIVKHALDTEDQDAEGLLNRIRARMERYALAADHLTLLQFLHRCLLYHCSEDSICRSHIDCQRLWCCAQGGHQAARH